MENINPELTDKIFKRGFASGKEHSTPSPETLNLFKNMNDKIDEIKKTLGDLRVDIAKLPEKIFEKGDTKYANKTTEKIVYGMVGTILTLVLIAVVYLVINKWTNDVCVAVLNIQ